MYPEGEYLHSSMSPPQAHAGITHQEEIGVGNRPGSRISFHLFHFQLADSIISEDRKGFCCMFIFITFKHRYLFVLLNDCVLWQSERDHLWSEHTRNCDPSLLLKLSLWSVVMSFSSLFSCFAWRFTVLVYCHALTASFWLRAGTVRS